MNSQKGFGQGIKVAETDKLNIDSIIARLLEGKIFFFGLPFDVFNLAHTYLI
jgi:hypothetical protein